MKIYCYFCLVLRIALPGIYPPFLLKASENMTKSMKECGVSARDFFQKIGNKQIEIPINFSIFKTDNNRVLSHTNQISSHLLRNLTCIHNSNSIIIQRQEIGSGEIEASNNNESFEGDDNTSLMNYGQSEDDLGVHRKQYGEHNLGQDDMLCDVHLQRGDVGSNENDSGEDDGRIESNVVQDGNGSNRSSSEDEDGGNNSRGEYDDGSNSNNSEDNINDQNFSNDDSIDDSSYDSSDDTSDDASEDTSEDNGGNHDSDDDDVDEDREEHVEDNDDDPFNLLSTQERRSINSYTHPSSYTAKQTMVQTGMTKPVFKAFCQKRYKYCLTKRCVLSKESQILCYIQRYRKAKPYDDLSADFKVSKSVCHRVCEKLMYAEVKNATNIPYFLRQESNDEVDKTLEFCHKESTPLATTLASMFKDPLGIGRIPVILLIDATYVYMEQTSDIMLQKQSFCKFKGTNCLKLTCITTATGMTFYHYLIFYMFSKYNFFSKCRTYN